MDSLKLTHGELELLPYLDRKEPYRLLHQEYLADLAPDRYRPVLATFTKRMGNLKDKIRKHEEAEKKKQSLRVINLFEVDFRGVWATRFSFEKSGERHDQFDLIDIYRSHLDEPNVFRGKTLNGQRSSGEGYYDTILDYLHTRDDYMWGTWRNGNTKSFGTVMLKCSSCGDRMLGTYTGNGTLAEPSVTYDWEWYRFKEPIDQSLQSELPTDFLAARWRNAKIKFHG